MGSLSTYREREAPSEVMQMRLLGMARAGRGLGFLEAPIRPTQEAPLCRVPVLLTSSP